MQTETTQAQGNYQAVTRAISVTVAPEFLAAESDPERARFVWAYHVRIENTGPETVRLRRRYWHITDGGGLVHEVEGEGVVGEQPLLQPGMAFEYTSGTPLSTSSGIMAGRYTMETPSGERFDVEIPAFSLDTPNQKQRLN